MINKSERLVISMGWLIINLMAAYGAATLLGGYAWIYVAFFVSYLYTCSQIGKGGKK